MEVGASNGRDPDCGRKPLLQPGSVTARVGDPRYLAVTGAGAGASAWHPVEKRVVMTHLSMGGAVLHGWEEMPGENTREHEFKGVASDGSEFRFRDTARITGPDTHESASFKWENGAWVAQRKMQWRRVKVAG